MNPTATVGNALIFDDFLDEALFNDLWTMMNQLQYQRSDSEYWLNVWPLNDGTIMRNVGWSALAPNWIPKPNDNRGIKAPPAMLKFLEHIRKTFVHNQSDQKINGVNLTPCVWPPKSSITWHRDGSGVRDNRIGAFTFYLHKEWNAEWGGELMLSPLEEELAFTPFDNSEVSNKLMAEGFGTWIAPKPNRLIMNPSNAYHKVAKTTDNAAPRLTIQGFMVSRD